MVGARPEVAVTAGADATRLEVVHRHLRRRRRRRAGVARRGGTASAVAEVLIQAVASLVCRLVASTRVVSKNARYRVQRASIDKVFALPVSKVSSTRSMGPQLVSTAPLASLGM